MSSSLRFLSKSIPGYGPNDGSCLPCSGVPGRAMCISQYSAPYDFKFSSDIKLLPLRCASRHSSYVCNATPNNYRRSPDISRQNKQSFSRNRNRHNEDRDGYDDFEESDSFSSKNGSVLSFSGNQKFQSTLAPGPREKEIVELFRKVQAQLRERAAKKEDRKVEDTQGKSKEDDENVDCLVKLLREHSVQQGKKNTNSVSKKDFILDSPEQVVPSRKEKRLSIPVPVSSLKPEIAEIPTPHPARPKSNFQKRSPVPEIKFQPIFKGSSESVPQERLDAGRKGVTFSSLELDMDSDSESDSDSLEPGVDVFDELLEDEISDVDDDDEDDEEEEVEETPSEVMNMSGMKPSDVDEDDDEEEEETAAEVMDLSGMKLIELRAVAKARGMKGYSKLKKNELIDMLSGSTT